MIKYAQATEENRRFFEGSAMRYRVYEHLLERFEDYESG
jgi:hypothetical protein